MFPIFIPSYDRWDTHTTYWILKEMGIPSKVVVHDQYYERYLAHMPKEDLLTLHAPPGLSNNRNAIIDYVGAGWHIQMSDDAKKFQIVSDKFYNAPVIEVSKDKNLEKEYQNPMTGDKFIAAFEELAKEAEKRGVYMAGFAITDNEYFRESKWVEAGLCDGRVLLLRGGEKFDTEIYCIDDYAFTSENLFKHGAILRNNYVFPDFRRYTKDSYGSQAARYERKLKDCLYLMAKYPGLMRLKHFPEEKRVDLLFNLRNRQQVDKWRTVLAARRKQKLL